MEDEALQKELGTALEMEEKGYEFYKDLGKKSVNEITRKTFDFLADKELLHIEDIKKFYNALKEKEKLPSINLAGIKKEREKDLNEFLDKISDLNEKVKPSDDDKKACEHAMELENSGYKYYERMLKKAGDANLVKFLKFLMAEEARHYEGIQQLHSYLTDSQNWFMYEEGAFPQGG